MRNNTQRHSGNIRKRISKTTSKAGSASMKHLSRPLPCGIHLDPVALALCSLFDFVEDLQFWIKDPEGRYVWLNRGFVLNYSFNGQEDLIGKTDYDVSPRHLADQFRLDDDRVLAGETIINRIELIGRFDHTACWSLTNKVPLRDARGRIIGTTGVAMPLKGKVAEHTWPDLALAKVAVYIREHYMASITNKELARISNLSVRAFERHFQHCFHVSPQRYIKRVRVRMTCHALVFSDQPLTQIAIDHGFSDQSHFTREFRHQMAMTPRQYRARYRDVRAPRRFPAKL